MNWFRRNRVTRESIVDRTAVTKVFCELEGKDYAETAANKTSRGRRLVNLKVYADGDFCHVAVTPAVARAFAAGILNAADEADGATPLYLSNFPRAQGAS